MEQMNLIGKIAAEANGIIRKSKLSEAGITDYRIRCLIKLGILQRIKPGYYRLLSESDDISEAALVSKLFPDGVLCMYTALFYYKYSDRTPLAWDIAINKDTSKSRFKLDYPYLQPYFLEPEFLSFGISSIEIDGSTMKIFDRDRLICECIFYENKIARETYNKAIQGYIADTKKNIANLMKYAEKRRISKKVKERIGMWL